MIDGATNGVVATIAIGSDCRGIDIDEASNTIYATGRFAGTLVVIDGASDRVTDTVALGGHPFAVAVNPSRQRIYVTKDGLFVPGNTVTILDQVTHAVLSTRAVGNRPLGVDVSPATGRVYVSNLYSYDIYVLGGEDDAVAQVVPFSGYYPYGVGINRLTDRVYVANAFGNSVSVLEDDLEAPTWPPATTLSVYEARPASLTLQWTAAVDNAQVRGYRVYRDGVLALDFATDATTYVYAFLGNLAADTSYTFKVEACDEVNNCSTNGPTLVARTLSVSGAIAALAASVDGLGAAGVLTTGQVAGLRAKLLQGLQQYNAGHFKPAIDLLQAFVTEVDGLQKAGALPASTAYQLTLEANLILGYLQAAMP